jgi:hypothetical protein
VKFVIEAEVAAVDVVEERGHEEAVIERGVEDGPAVGRGAGDFDRAQGLGPGMLCLLADCGEVFPFGLGGEVFFGASGVNVGDADLYGDDLLLLLRCPGCVSSGCCVVRVLPGCATPGCNVSEAVVLVALPGAEGGEGPIEEHREIDLELRLVAAEGVLLDEAFDTAVAYDVDGRCGNIIERVTDGDENIRVLVGGKGETRDAGSVCGSDLGVDAPLQELHLVVAGGCGLPLMGEGGLVVGDLGDDWARSGGEKYVAFIGAADAAHVRHAETFKPRLDVVVAEAVVFRVGAQLHHAEGKRGAGEQIDAIHRITACADERMHAGCGIGFRGRVLSAGSVDAEHRQQQKGQPKGAAYGLLHTWSEALHFWSESFIHGFSSDRCGLAAHTSCEVRRRGQQAVRVFVRGRSGWLQRQRESRGPRLPRRRLRALAQGSDRRSIRGRERGLCPARR